MARPPRQRAASAVERKRALTVMRRLAREIPEAKIQLEHRSAFELLVAVILSAQCTDARVNLVTPALFARFPDAASLARASTSDVEALIQSCGLYRMKARSLIGAANALVQDHGGEVPRERAVLETLPGVGRKTAGVVCIHRETDVGFPVDTHVARIAYRLGFTDERHPDKIERDLRALLPSSWWTRGHQLFIWHGRRTCIARGPKCDVCVVRPQCPRRGVAQHRSNRLTSN